MGWTISVGQNKLELDQFLARKFIMEIIEIENIFICPYIDDLATSFQIALLLTVLTYIYVAPHFEILRSSRFSEAMNAVI